MSSTPAPRGQLGDGYQAHIGDRLDVNVATLPSTSVARIAAMIRDAGRTAGLWIAPFLASPQSRVAQEHPDWFARHEPKDVPLMGGYNPRWGGAVWVLDTTAGGPRAHRRDGPCAVDMGLPYLKLDFTYAPSLLGTYADPSQTPAQRVRAGMEAVRRGAGESAFLLGCGLPLAEGVGVVDGMRIGPDVAPHWSPKPQPWAPPAVAQRPGLLMLRTTETELSGRQVSAWARAVGESGGMSLLGSESRALLDEVIATGRASDAARWGRGVTAPAVASERPSGRSEPDSPTQIDPGSRTWRSRSTTDTGCTSGSSRCSARRRPRR